MPTYKGNDGHLMQHWTLCELLDIADEKNVPGLSFIDAHAMAPVAESHTEELPERRRAFDRKRAGLSDQQSIQSVYERAWRQLAPESGYPNSANFVQRVWTRDFSMLLCEKDPATITALDTWLPSVQGQPRCKRAKVAPGDWRDRFCRGLPSPTDIGLPDGSLTLISFDPNMYDRNGPPLKPKPENMYPCDLHVAVGAVKDVAGAVLIQISTYSAQNDNAQKDVITSIGSILKPVGFKLIAKVKLNGNMMSLVYARGISWGDELADLPKRFSEWL